MIRFARHDDIETLVAVHMQAFDGFFLTKLGPGFLRLFYESYIEEPEGFAFVWEEDGEVMAVVCGANSPVEYFSAIRRKRGLKFLSQALPALVRHPITVTRKLWYALKYRGDKIPAIENATLISSLAVNPACTGKGIGASMMNHCADYARECGAKRTYLTTDKYNNDGVINLHKRCGYVIHSTFEQPGKRVMYRMVKEL